jgi:hypothetical protein
MPTIGMRLSTELPPPGAAELFFEIAFRGAEGFAGLFFCFFFAAALAEALFSAVGSAACFFPAVLVLFLTVAMGTTFLLAWSPCLQKKTALLS